MGSGYGLKFDPKKHLKFNEIKDTGKTKVWEIENKHQNTTIGLIKWNGGWRKYCLFPYEDTMFDTKCIKTIMEFIDDRMNERKEARKKK